MKSCMHTKYRNMLGTKQMLNKWLSYRCGGGYFKEDINFTSLTVPRGLWECEPLRGGRADKEQCKNKVDKEQCNPHHSVSHCDSTCSGFPGFVQRHVRLSEFPGHVSKRFLNSFHTKVVINSVHTARGEAPIARGLCVSHQFDWK